MPQGNPSSRSTENAPGSLRQEFVDVLYQVAETRQGITSRRLNVDEDLYLVIEQTLGVPAAGNPMPNKRQRLGRDLGNAEWVRVYDVVERLWPEFYRVGAHELYRLGVNRILAANGVAWDLGPDGRLQRVLPIAAQNQIAVTFQELSGNVAFVPALKLFQDARCAYDARPRRDRDACANMFDAMESIAKIRMGEPNNTFHGALAKLRSQNRVAVETMETLEKFNTLRNKHFGHGMTVPFALTPAEVDFSYLGCMAGALLFARLQ